jgi:hypothetical protein
VTKAVTGRRVGERGEDLDWLKAGEVSCKLEKLGQIERLDSIPKP